MRKIGFFLLALAALACVSCGSRLREVKPVLKPRVVPIAQRIVDQNKWLDQDIAAKAVKPRQAKPIRARIEQIKKKYDLLRSIGPLTSADSQVLNRMLDKTSEQIFRLGTKVEGVHR